MGIKGFHQLVKKYVDEIYITKSLSDYAFKKVAIDVSLFIFKYKANFRERWINAFLTLIATLRKYDVHPVFIFDGKAPKEKDEERAARAESREKLSTKVETLQADLDAYDESGIVSTLMNEIWEKQVGSSHRLLGGGKKPFNSQVVRDYLENLKSQIIRISADDIELARGLFQNCGIPFIQAPGEAETYASHLCVHGLVDAVASEDTDVLAYGTPVFITKINSADGTCVEMLYDSLIEKMQLSPQQFTDLCIMCGTDYNSNIPKVGPDTSYKLLMQYGSIEEIAKIVDPKTGEPKYDVGCLKHVRVRELFAVPAEMHVKIPFCTLPDIAKLRRWLWENNIHFSLDKIVDVFQSRSVEFDEEE